MTFEQNVDCGDWQITCVSPSCSAKVSKFPTEIRQKKKKMNRFATKKNKEVWKPSEKEEGKKQSGEIAVTL